MADHMAFLVSQAHRIESEVYRIEYPDIQYPMLVPVDMSAGMWAKGITYFSQDSFGRADFLANRANDIPLADITRSMHETAIEAGTIGYDYTEEELAQASMLGLNLTSDKAESARRAAEEMIDRLTLYGDTDHGWSGLLNNANVQKSSATEKWTAAGKTPDEIIKDVNDLLTGVWDSSKTVEMADTLALPTTMWSLLANTPRSANSDMSIMEWIRRYNIYTALTQRPLTMVVIRGLEAVSGVTGQRIIAYKRDPRALKLHLPMSFRFWPPQQMLFRYIVPGMFRTGGLEIRLPGTMRYLDDVAAQ